MTSSAYALDNTSSTAGAMLDCLSEILDPLTRQRLDAAGVEPGNRCLEVGAGNGSIAQWLAGRVGPDGLVVATDIDPVHIAACPQMRVLVHDIAGREPLPGPFDVIHARLVLAHLPERRQILSRLAALLAPGGVLLVEEWGAWSGPLLVSGSPGAGLVYQRYQQALLEVFRAAGHDPSWGFQVADLMVEAGLADVDVVAAAESWPGGSPGCRLPIVVSGQLRQKLLAAGMDSAELTQLVQVMADEQTLILGNVTVSTCGIRG